MKYFKRSTQNSLLLLAGVFFGLGIYNSVVINSTDFLNNQHPRFVKRLDEMKGEFKAGRIVANHGSWVNLGKVELTKYRPEIKMVKKSNLSKSSLNNNESVENTSASAIKEDLDLIVTQVFSAKKYPNALNANQVSGQLRIVDGVLETLSVQLPQNESVQISGVEIIGNVFEYEQNGENLSGMVYSKGDHAYMIVLANGPFEGMRMSFEAPKEEVIAEEQAEPVQAEEKFEPVVTESGEEVAVGQFGVQPPTTDVVYSEENQAPAVNENQENGSYGFNFENNNQVN
jgi:hypothetical protein